MQGLPPGVPSRARGVRRARAGLRRGGVRDPEPEIRRLVRALPRQGLRLVQQDRLPRPPGHPRAPPRDRRDEAADPVEGARGRAARVGPRRRDDDARAGRRPQDPRRPHRLSPGQGRRDQVATPDAADPAARRASIVAPSHRRSPHRRRPAPVVCRARPSKKPYPESARRARIQGTTLLRIHIETDGRVSDVTVERSAGNQSLDQAAADAVRRWRFEPALSSAGPVAMSALVPVEFRIGERD
ncbi:MAG: hypothetical protein DMD87_01350 [Candidatus Rokuibacteriota bacterium]|nr:MAG: hypothetical protein DMD87_01350 [Candidatus Rokubacteria bacterium]